MLKKDDAILGLLLLVSIGGVYLYKSKKKMPEDDNALDFVQSARDNVVTAFDNIGGAVTNFGNSAFQNISDFSSNIFGINSDIDGNSELDQFGTAENPTGFFVLNHEAQDAIDNGGGIVEDEQPSFFQRASNFFRWGG